MLITVKIGKSYRIDDEVVQDQRQRDDNDLQDERQDQPKEEEVEPRRSKRARTEKSFGPDFVSFMVENEPTSYREALDDIAIAYYNKLGSSSNGCENDISKGDRKRFLLTDLLEAARRPNNDTEQQHFKASAVGSSAVVVDISGATTG
ncbi:hypothetical protein Tco_0333061 [Tanacetum coccineum]